jgi:hypothetical protein
MRNPLAKPNSKNTGSERSQMMKSAFLALAAVIAFAAPVQARDIDNQQSLAEKYREFANRSMQRHGSGVSGELCGIYLPQADGRSFSEFMKNPASIFLANASGTSVLVKASQLINASTRAFPKLLDAASTGNRVQRLAIGAAIASATASCHPLEASEGDIMANIISASIPEVLMGYASYKAGVPTATILGDATTIIRASVN